MKPVLRCCERVSFMGVASLIAGSLIAGSAAAATRDITLPAETATLRSSPLAGYAIARQKCGICHSADYINLQPPHMTLAQWTAEMVKMQHSYGAPIDDAQIKLLGIYLASAYGDVAVSPEDAALALPAPAITRNAASPPGAAGEGNAVTGPAPDVHAVLDHNGCLSCHALQQKLVGPAYHAVAIKYAGDAGATAKIEANIQAGGSGKWGPIPMPAFPDLTPQELHALAQFVLTQ